MRRRNPKAKGKENKTKAIIDERRKIVAANIMAGLNYRTIAKALGVSPATICKDFKAIIAEWRKEQTEIIDDWALLENSRLEVMINGLWDSARKGNHAAIDLILKIMERRAKLFGLDAPVAAKIKAKHVAIRPAVAGDRLVLGAGFDARVAVFDRRKGLAEVEIRRHDRRSGS